MIKKLHSTYKLTLAVLVLFMLIPGLGWSQVSMTTTGSHTQNFNTLATSGTTNAWADNSTIANWYSQRTGTGTTYTADAGTGNGGTLYSYGTGTATERALGTIGSSNAAAGSFAHGVLLRNTSGNAITTINVTYTLEEWRKGGVTAAQDITFYYKISSSAITELNPNVNSGWTQVTGLTLSSPINTASPAPLDGNAAANKVTATNVAIPSLSLANNDYIMLKWEDPDHTSTDHGLSIDDVTINWTVTPASSSSSDINGAANETSNIPYATYQATSITATSDAVRLFSFTIRDGGSSADVDALPTILASITLSKGGSNGVTSWANILRKAALFDGSTKVAEVSVTGETIAFTGLSGSNVTAADDGTKTLDLYVTFESAVTDNQQFQFQITNANVAAAASGSSTFSAFAAVTSNVTNDANRIEVTASDIIFDQIVSTVALGAVMSPSPTLRAIDANVNYDLDYGSGWSVAVTSGTTTFDAAATTSGSFSSGLATLSNLKFDAAGTSNNLTVTSGSFTDISSAFDVTNPLPEINVKQVSTNYLTGSEYGFGSQVSGTSPAATIFTIENLGSAALNLTGTPKIAISGTNAGEFTIDQTTTASTVAVSGSTTFTLTFSPTSQGSKTAAISIANDDATGSENPYIINLTGTGTVSAASDITNTGGYSYTSNVAYASYQSASTLTTGNSVGVNGLTIRDGGATTDADNLGTTLTAISFTTGVSTAILTAALFDGSTNVSEVAVNGATTIAFTGLSLTAADNGTKAFELRVTYQSTVTDNQQITFTISSATASATGSGFAAADAGAAASAVTGDINRIEVTATMLAFVAQPSNTSVGVNMSPSVTVKATDANSTDLDFVSNIDITSSGTLSSSPQSSAASAGIATFSTINHTLAATGLTLNAASGVLASATSSIFNIIALPIAAWQFGNPAALGTEVTYNATTNNSNLNTCILSRGVGISATALVRAFAATSWDNAASKANAVTNDEYFEYTISPKAGYKVSLSTLDATIRRSGSTAPNSYIWKYSTDGTTYTEIGTDISYTGTSEGGTQPQIDLSGISALQNISSIIYFRLYAWGGTSTNATFSFGRYATGLTSNSLAIGGSVFIPIGEPTNHATNFTAASNTSSSVSLTWSDATGAQLPEYYLVKAVVGSSAPSAPVDGTAQADATLVKNIAYGTQACTFTGLTANTTYTFNIWPYTNTGVNINYKTDVTAPITTSGTTGENTWTGTTDTDWNTAGNWSAVAVPTATTHNISIPIVTNFPVVNQVSATPAVCNNLTIASGAVLTINAGKALSVSGSLTNNAGNTGLVLKSDVNGTGSLIHNTASVAATVERYITGSSTLTTKQYHQVSIPLTSAASPTSNLFVGSFLFDFTEAALTSGDWNPLGNSTSTALDVDKGYLIYYPENTPATYTFAGPLRNGTVSPAITYAADESHGYNLIPNPYPSAIDWDASSGWALTHVDDAIYVWNSASSTSNYGSFVGVTSTNGVNNIIPVGQAFFVKANAASPSISMTNSVRVHNAKAFMKNGTELNANELHLFAEVNGIKDEIAVRFAADVTANFDKHADAYKMFGYSETPQLYSVTPDGTQLSINSLPFTTGNVIVPLAFSLNATTDITFTASGMESFYESIPMYLEDLTTGTITDLRANPVYTFSHTAGEAGNRFRLRFKGVTGTPEQPTTTPGHVFVSQGKLFVDIPAMQQSMATLSVFDALGRQLISRKEVLQGIVQLPAPTAPGVYIVRVMAGNISFTGKVVVNQ